MNKILVTGASGFLGRRVIPLLAESGYEVYALQRNTCASDSRINYVSCDLANEKQTEQVIKETRPSHLLHLAWYTEHGKFWDSLDNIDWIRRSLHLVQKFTEYGGKRAIITGSCAEYSWNQEKLSEDHNSFHPASLYGQCKNFLYKILLEYAKTHSLSLAWARIFFLFGHDEPKGKIVASMMDHFLSDRTFVLKNGHLKRDFLHVEDVASALAKIIASSFQGAINIASGQPTSLSEMGQLLQNLVGRGRIEVQSTEIKSDQPISLIGDVDKLKNIIGWEPKFSIKEGLQEVISRYTT